MLSLGCCRWRAVAGVLSLEDCNLNNAAIYFPQRSPPTSGVQMYLSKIRISVYYLAAPSRTDPPYSYTHLFPLVLSSVHCGLYPLPLVVPTLPIVRSR